MSQETFRRSVGGTPVYRLFLSACAAFAGLGVVAAWFISADQSSIVGVEPFLRFMVSPWMLMTHFVAGAFIVFGLWFLGSSPSRSSKLGKFEYELRRTTRLLSLVFIIFALSLVTIGYLFVDDVRTTFRQQQFAQQQSIARLKAQQVDRWILDRAVDIQTVAASMKALPLGQLTSSPEASQFVRILFAEFMAGNADRTGIALLAPDGRVLIGTGELPEPGDLASKPMETTDGRTAGIRIVDLHLEGGPPPTLGMDFVLPIGPANGIGPPSAVLVTTIDPDQELFRQIATWPTTSPGSEVLLVRRDGDELLVLTPPALLGRVPPPLSFRLPLSRATLPGVQAILQGDGVREGVDYRGSRVISASHHVTGVPWFVIAKSDASEVMQPLHQKTAIVAAAIGIAILVAALMLVVLWRGQRAGYLAFRDQQVEERSALATHFEQLIRSARDIVFLFDPAGNILDCNDAAVTAYGYSAEELHKFNVRDLVPPEELPNIERGWTGELAPEGHLIEGVHRRKDGTKFPVEISSRPVSVDGHLYRQAFIRDITVRKSLERELGRLARIQKGLLEGTGILLRARSEAELFEGMCKVIVNDAGYRLAYVAVANHDERKSVHFPTIAGIDEGYVAQTAITWGEGERSMGPTGAAIRTGEIQINQDFASNPRMVPWRQEALKRGLRASIGLPLRASGEVFGVLTIYAEQPDAFNAEEVPMLAQLAEDISYGVTALRSRAAAAAVGH